MTWWSSYDNMTIIIVLTQFAGLIEELKQKVDESKTECAYQLRLKDNQNLEQIKEINKKARVEKDSLGKNINSLQQEIGNLTKDNEGKLQKVRMSFKKWSLIKSNNTIMTMNFWHKDFFSKVVATNERTLMDQGDLYKSKLVRPFHSKHLHLQPVSKKLGAIIIIASVQLIWFINHINWTDISHFCSPNQMDFLKSFNEGFKIPRFKIS